MLAIAILAFTQKAVTWKAITKYIVKTRNNFNRTKGILADKPSN